MNPPFTYFFSILILLFVTASIKRSRIIDYFGDKILSNNNERFATILLVILSYILSPLFLSFVLLSSFDKWLLRFRNKSRISVLLLTSTLLGGIILPFGNMRNIYITIFYGGGSPGIPLSDFVRVMFPLWIAGLIILLIYSYFSTVKDEIKQKKTKTKWRWKELVFSLILLIFIIAYFNGKMNALGFLFITGAFSFAFISMETLKQVDWWVLIPAGFVFVFYYLLNNIDITLNVWTGFFTGSICSLFLSSNILSYILPFSGMESRFLLYAISVGGLGGILGTAESIFMWRKGRVELDWKLMLRIYGICLLVALLILVLGGFYG
ncbi:hypothetical protein KAX08_03750 [candidate division WOR-3 bacterium]|nr:hypothetical protein [candidate division WOR-3 bacterium]